MEEVFEVLPVLAAPKFAVSSVAAFRNRVYVAAEDGSLRIFADSEDPGAGARPRLDLLETVSRFSRDRKPIRGLQVIPAWNALLSLCDSAALVHSLDGLSRPGLVLPDSKGCLHASASSTCGLVAVAHRGAVRFLSWNGKGSTTATAASASASTASSSELFSLVSERQFGPTDAASDVGSGSSSGRERGMSIVAALGAAAGGGGSGRGSRYVSPHVCITRIAWCGPLLCASVVHRSDVSLSGDAGLSELDQELATVRGCGCGLEGEEEEVPPALVTAYVLSYAFVHPWTGQIMREIRAGPAPALDSNGMLTAPSAQAAAAATASSAAAAAADDAAIVARSQALAAAVSPAAAPLPPNAPATAAAPLMWGCVAVAQEANDADSSSAGGGGRSGASAGGEHGSSGDLPARARSASEYGVGVHAGDGDAAEGEAWDSIAEDGGDLSVSGSGGHGSGGRGRSVSAGGHNALGASGVGASGGLSAAAGKVYLSVVCADDTGSAAGVGAAAAVANGVGSLRPSHISGYRGTAGGRSSGLLSFKQLPSDLYASPTFPYIVACDASGVRIYNPKTGTEAQAVRLAQPLGIAVCPDSLRARHDFSSNRLEQAAGPDANSDWSDSVRRVMQQPERMFVFARNGILCLRMVPVVMQVAALLSRRPPLFEAALALCDHFKAIRRKLAAPGASAALHSRSASETGGDGSPEGGSGAAAPPQPVSPGPQSSWDVLGGVSEHKIRSIRSQFGYQLFARGEFAQALMHLAHAQEPVRAVLALHPQLLPRGCNIRAHYPIQMPVLMDAMLPLAVRPLIHYLLLQRKRLRCYTGRVEFEEAEGSGDEGEGEGEGDGEGSAGGGARRLAAEDSTPRRRLIPIQRLESAMSSGSLLSTQSGSTSGGGGGGGGGGGAGAGGSKYKHAHYNVRLDGTGDDSDGDSTAEGSGSGASGSRRHFPTAVLVDTMLLTAYLWLHAHYRSLAGSSQQTGLSAQGTALASMGPEEAQAQADKLHRALLALLHSPNVVDVGEAEAQLAAFGFHDGEELVALYSGQGLHERALRLLAADADAAVKTAASVGLSLRISWLDEDNCHRVKPAVARLLSLGAYLRGLGAPHAMLVLKYAQPMLAGAAGSIGVLVGLYVLMAPPNTSRTGSSGSSSGRRSLADAPFQPLPPAQVLATLQRCSLKGDYPQFWTLQAPSTFALQAVLDVDRIRSSLLGSEVGVAEDGSSEAAAAEVLADDARYSPTPVAGWARHLQIAYLEFALGCHLRPSEVAMEASLVPAVDGATKRQLTQALVSAYCSAIGELLQHRAQAEGLEAATDYKPTAVVAEETGLLGEYRRRFARLMTRHGGTLDALAALACLPSPHLLVERASLLRAAGRHEAALCILVHDLRDYTAAEEYCSAVYHASNGTGDVYSALLRAYLSPRTTASAAAAAAEAATATAAAASVTEAASPPNPVSRLLKRHSISTSTTSAGAAQVRDLSANGSGGIVMASTAAAADAASAPSLPAGPSLVSQLLLGHRLMTATSPAATAATAAATGAAATATAESADGAAAAASGDSVTAVERVMGILGRNPSRVVAADALALLPPHLPLSALLPFLQASVRLGADAARTHAATRSLSLLQRARTEYELVKRQKRAVTVEKSSVCGVCNRRLAAGGKPGSIAVYPNGVAVHAACATDPNVCPVTMTRFKQELRSAEAPST